MVKPQLVLHVNDGCNTLMTYLLSVAFAHVIIITVYFYINRERTQPYKKYKSASNRRCFCCGVYFGWLWNRRKQCSSCLRPVCYRDLSESLCELCVETRYL